MIIHDLERIAAERVTQKLHLISEKIQMSDFEGLENTTVPSSASGHARWNMQPSGKLSDALTI